MTNADKIRAMTDEELADKLAFYLDCDNCPFHGCSHFVHNYKICREAVFDWLKQEVSENG